MNGMSFIRNTSFFKTFYMNFRIRITKYLQDFIVILFGKVIKLWCIMFRMKRRCYSKSIILISSFVITGSSNCLCKYAARYVLPVQGMPLIKINNLCIKHILIYFLETLYFKDKIPDENAFDSFNSNFVSGRPFLKREIPFPKIIGNTAS